MEGYPQVTKLYAQALDSAGTAQQKFQAYQEGTTAKLDKLKASWEAVWMSAFQSNTIQNIISGFTSVANGVQKVTSALGDLPVIVGTATTAFFLFNNKMKETIMLNGQLVTKAFAALIPQFRTLENSLVASQSRLAIWGRGWNTAVGMVKTSLSSLKAVAASTFTFLAGAAVPLAVFTGISLVIQKLTDNYQKAQQAEKELQQQSDKLVSSYKNHKDEINKLVKQYEDLSTIRSNSKLDNDQEKQYTDIQNQLAKLLPTISAGETAKGDAVLKSSDAIKDQIKLLDQAIKLQKEKNTLDAPKNIRDNANSINKTSSMGSQTGGLQQQLDYSKRISDSYEKDLKNAKEEKLTSSEIVEIRRELQNELVKQNGIQQQINSKNQSNASSIKSYFSGMKIDSSALTQVAFDLTSISLKGKSLGDIDGMFKGISKSVNALNNALKDNDKKAIKDAENSLESYGVKGKLLQKIIADLVNALNQKSDASKKDSKANKDESFSAEELSKKLSDAKGSFSKTKDAIMDMIKSKQLDMAITSSQTQLYSEMSDKLSPVNQALENLANGQSLTASSAMDLIQKVPEMTKYLSIQNGQVQVNVQGIIDWRDAQVKAFQDAINAEKAQIDAQAKGLKTKLKNYGVEIQAILSVADANKALAEAQDQYNQKMNALNNSADAMHASTIGGQQSLTDKYKSLTDGINSIKDAYNNLDQLSSMASTGLTQVGTSMDKTSSSAEQSTYVTDKYKQSMEQLTTALEKLKNLQQQYPNYSKSYRDALQQEISLLQQQKDLTDAQAKNLQGQISSGIIQQTGMVKSSSGGSSSSSNYNYASGGSTQAQVWNFLKGKGLSDSAIAGIMGNLQVESGFSTTVRNSSSGATGLAQWLGSRLSSLQSQPNWTSLDTQLNFLWSEWSKMMPGNFNGLSASQAATTFESLFERSGGSLNSKRVADANSILSQFAGSGGTYSGGSSSSSSSAADMAQAVDQAKSDLLNLQQTSSSLQNQIQDIYLQMVQSQAAYYDHIKTQYDAQLAQYDYLQNVEDKNSADWLHTQMNREAAYQQQIKAEQDSISYLQQQIAYNNQLNEAQKATLSDDVLQRQQEVLSIEQKLFDTRSQMADEIVSTYKTALQDMKDAATKSIDDMINTINKEADQADYKKKLADAQKSAQDIQDEINKLMLDDSTAAKKRIADLQKQLSDQNDSISQMVADNNKQQQIDNLNAQKDSISTYYDNMMNDEQKFAQMRTDILNINNQSIIDSLNSLSTQVQANVNLLGTSVVNTLIDAVNRANGYLGLSTQNAGVIGHIASLSVGGITPSWSGSDGKLAVLHQDEMISNKVDTNNFLKSINLVKDLVTNFIKPMNLSGVLSPATAGGNNYYVNFNVDKMTGNQSDVNNFVTKFVNGIKAKGGVI